MKALYHDRHKQEKVHSRMMARYHDRHKQEEVHSRMMARYFDQRKLAEDLQTKPGLRLDQDNLNYSHTHRQVVNHLCQSPES